MLGERNINITITVSTRKMAAGVAKANAQLGTLNKTAGRVLRTMTAFAALFVARAFIRGIGESVKAFASFEKGIANIDILLDKSDKRIGLFKETIRSLAQEFGVGTKDLLKAGFDIQSAIGDVSTSIDVLNAATKGAVAGGSNVADTTAGLLTLMESYGDKLKGAADGMNLLLLAQKFARADIGQLSMSVSKFLPIARTMGVSAEELFAVFSQLTRALGNTKEASTALGMFLNKMLKPTQKMKDLAKETWNMSIQEALAKKDLIEVMKVLGALSLEEIGSVVNRQRAIKALTSTIGESAKMTAWANEMLERQGYVDEKLLKQMKQTEVQLGRITEKWQDLMRVAGDKAVQSGILDFVEDWIDGLKILLGLTKEQIAAQKRGATVIKEWKETSGVPAPEEDKAGIDIKPLIDWVTKKLIGVIIKVAEVESQMIANYKARMVSGAGIAPWDTKTPKVQDEATTAAYTFKDPSWEEFQKAQQNMTSELERYLTERQDLIIKDQDILKELESQFYDWKEEITLKEKIDVIDAAQAQVDADIAKNDAMKKSAEKLHAYKKILAKTEQQMWVDAAATALKHTQTMYTMFSQTIKMAIGDSKEYAWALKALRMGQIVIDTAAAVMQVMGDATIPSTWLKLGMAGMISAMGATQLAIVAGTEMQKGGIVPGIGRGDRVPAMLEPGELVIPRDQVGSVTNNNNPSVVVNLSGNILVDDPNAIEKLYREHIRDRIMTDIRTGRDRFYG